MRITKKFIPGGPSACWKFYYLLKNPGQDYVPRHVAFNLGQNGWKSYGHSRGQSIVYLDGCEVFVRCFSTSSYTLPARHEAFRRCDVNNTIWENENVIVVDPEKGSRCETNQLASNQPNEDQLFITRSTLNKGDVMLGVIDGHGGSTFGKVIKQRLPYYLHSALCNKQLYHDNSLTPVDLVETLHGNSVPSDEPWVKDLHSYMEDVINQENAGHTSSYVSRLQQLFMGTPQSVALKQASPFEGIAETIRTTFVRLDCDVTNEIKSSSEGGQFDSGLALSGCCALVAYVMEDEMFVANLGDCRAVLGTIHNGSWASVQLTADHTAATNSDEVQRILGEHPVQEARTCIQYGRLLGRLAPLRAFGDVQFKLTGKELESMFKVLPDFKLPTGLHSPPYLSAEPDVFHYQLESTDKFIVLASDGLWDMLSNDEVVELVAAYIEGRRVDLLKEKAHLFGVANCNDIINDANAFSDSANENIASFLIRFALGGYDEENLKSMLTLPYPDVRLYRDDITVAVLFFDNYIDDS